MGQFKRPDDIYLTNMTCTPDCFLIFRDVVELLIILAKYKLKVPYTTCKSYNFHFLKFIVIDYEQLSASICLQLFMSSNKLQNTKLLIARYM